MVKAAIATMGLVAALIVIGARPSQCADIVGQVTANQGHPVVNVKVIVKDVNGKSVAEGATDVNGYYHITGLASGTYKYVLDTQASGFKGGDAIAYLGANGLTIDWKLSANAPAIALANDGVGTAIAGDPWGMTWPEFAGLAGGVVGTVAGGVVGGVAAAGGFSSSPASSSL